MMMAEKLILVLAFCSVVLGQVQRTSIDFSNANPDPETGKLCVVQQVKEMFRGSETYHFSRNLFL